jgi:serine/threonine protein kinase
MQDLGRGNFGAVYLGRAVCVCVCVLIYLWLQFHLLFLPSFGEHTSPSLSAHFTIILLSSLGIYKGSRVAVKEILEANVAFDPEYFYDSFAAEAEVMKSLKHRNIVQYYGLVANRKLRGIVCEFCEGGTLSDLLFDASRFNTLTLVIKARFAYDLIQGLYFLHANGILHRDLKTDNVLLDLSGIAKLADFGLSKHGHAGQGLTKVGPVCVCVCVCVCYFYLCYVRASPSLSTHFTITLLSSLGRAGPFVRGG